MMYWGRDLKRYPARRRRDRLEIAVGSVLFAVCWLLMMALFYLAAAGNG